MLRAMFQKIIQADEVHQMSNVELVMRIVLLQILLRTHRLLALLRVRVERAVLVEPMRDEHRIFQRADEALLLFRFLIFLQVYMKIL